MNHWYTQQYTNERSQTKKKAHAVLLRLYKTLENANWAIIAESDLMERVGDMHEQMGDSSSGMETTSESPIEMQQFLQRSQTWRFPSTGSSEHLTQLRNESMNWIISTEIAQTEIQSGGKKSGKKPTRVSKSCRTTSRVFKCVLSESSQEKEWSRTHLKNVSRNLTKIFKIINYRSKNLKEYQAR